MATWLVDALDMKSAFSVMRGSTWRPPVSVRMPIVEVPGRHGSVASPRIVYDSTTVTLRIAVERRSELTLEQATNRLFALLGSPVGVDLTRVSGGVSAKATGFLSSLTQDHAAFLPRSALALFVAVFSVPGTFFTETPTDSALVQAQDAGNWEIGTLAGSSAPVVSGKLRLKGPATSARFEDARSGTALLWTGSLLSTEYLFVDFGSVTAWKATSATSWSQSGVDQTGSLDYPPNGPLELHPEPVVNGQVESTKVALKLTGTGFTTGTTLMVNAGRSFL